MNKTMKNVKEIKSTEFVQEVLNSDKPVVVDFYAPWCGPCKMLAPVLDRLAGQYNGNVKFIKVNVDEAPMLAATYNITGVPTIMVFNGGRVVDMVVGFSTEGALKKMIDRVAPLQDEETGGCCSSGGCCCGW
jgi:thioredoxin 1